MLEDRKSCFARLSAYAIGSVRTDEDEVLPGEGERESGATTRLWMDCDRVVIATVSAESHSECDPTIGWIYSVL